MSTLTAHPSSGYPDKICRNTLTLTLRSYQIAIYEQRDFSPILRFKVLYYLLSSLLVGMSDAWTANPQWATLPAANREPHQKHLKEYELNTVIDLVRAYHFAAAKHVHQRRKGEAAEPYMNHLTEVAELVAKATDGKDIDVIIAAVLHDTVEDTDASLEELTGAFGQTVADLVAEVTDDKSLPNATRKLLQIEHAAQASSGAKIIKLADKTANLRALATSPPIDWSSARRKEYVDWARRVVQGCRGVSPWLEAQFDTAASRSDCYSGDRSRTA